MSMIKILALATCFNRKEKTIKAINSLVNGNRSIEFSFIICDDKSTDGTKELLEKYENVKVVNGTGKLFWCGGMRRTIEYALHEERKYDYCLFFNDDVDFFDGTIERIVNKAKDVVWVFPTCDINNNLTYGGVIKTSNFWPKYKTLMGNNVNGTDCDTFNGNCVLIPWDIFIEVGNMDSVYTHQFGDYDYGFMIKKHNYKIKVANEFVGICNTNGDSNTFNDKTLSIKQRLKLKKLPNKGLPAYEWFHYLYKNYNILTAIIYSITPYIKIIARR